MELERDNIKLPRDIITANVNILKGDLLLIDTYILDFAPEVLSKFSKNRNLYSFCPELHHIDKLGFKLCTIFRLKKVKSFITLTKDGSPHSLQIPLVVQEAAENSGFNKKNIKYFVFEKGESIEIHDRTVRKARHLSEIQKIIHLSYLDSLLNFLRSPTGCPNEQKETFKSVIAHLKEEINEVAEAVKNKDMQNLEAEMGDVLFNIALLSSIAGKKQKLSLYTILERLNQKITRRHQKYLRGKEIKY